MSTIDHVTDSVISRLVAALASATAGRPTLVKFTLHSGQSLSDAVKIPAGQRAISFTLPADWEASSLTFQASADGSAFFEVTDSLPALNFLTLTGAKAGMLIYAPTWSSARLPYLRIRSGTLAEAQAQGGDRILNLIVVNISAADH
jgi:hypothetical protein